MKDLSNGRIFGAATVGEKGQVVIPVEVRKSFKIKAGDKLIVFAKPGGMISFIPSEGFSRFITQASEAMSKLNK